MFSSIAAVRLLSLSTVWVFNFATISLLVYVVFGATTGSSHLGIPIPILLTILAGVSHSLPRHPSHGSRQPVTSASKGSSDGTSSDSAGMKPRTSCHGAAPVIGELCLDLFH